MLSSARIFRILYIIALVILLSQPAFAESNISLSRYTSHMYIAYNKVLVESSMLFSSKQTANFSIELPYDARRVINKVDGFEYPAILDSNKLLFYLSGNRNAKFSYITDELLEKDAFIASMTMPFGTEQFRLRVSLPEKAVLDKPVRKGSVTGNSIYPKPKKLETDGRVITVLWEFNNLKKGDELAFYVKYKKPARYLIPLILVIAVLLAILAVAAYLALRVDRRRVRSRVVIREVERPESVEKHLKEDEQQLVNVLKLKEGSCEQGTLRITTGFSKAKLSGLLKEMEERKIIHKEKKGKKNHVFLK